MAKLAGGIVTSFAVLIGAGLLMAGSGPVAQDPEQQEKKLKELEASRAALEKRLAEMDKGFQESLNRIKELEATRAALEKRLAEAEKNSGDSVRRAREMEAAQGSLEKRVVNAEKALQEASARLKEQQTVDASLEKRVVTAEKTLLESSTRLKEREIREASLEKRMTEGDKGRQELLSSVRELQAARAAAEKRLADAEKENHEASIRLRESQADQRLMEKRLEKSAQQSESRLQSALAGLEKRLFESEGQSQGLLGRLQETSDAAEQERQDRLRLRAELQRVKLALRAGGVTGPGESTQLMAPNPIEEHYASLGLVYEYLGSAAAKKLRLQEGEGLRILRIPLRTFAHESDLSHGDAIVRVNGVPIRSTGVQAPRIALEKWWEQPKDLPNFVINHLPGEKVELEYVRDGIRDRVQLRLACTKCGKACAFYGEAARR